jgi:glycosyltransferase involved in cell wall biosynthesis
MAGSVATWFLLKAHRVSVLLERYRRVLERRYGVHNINVRRHGILETTPPCPPDFSKRKEEFRILAFGKFGRYKRLEVMLDAFPLIRQRVPNAKLVVAGQDHPNRPGYMQGLAEQHRGDVGMEFLGYLPEAEIPSVFSRCNVAVLPYSSSGGPSGVAHQAAQFGLPIVASRIGDIVNVASEEELAVDYYQTDNARDLADKVIVIAQDGERERRMAEQNYAAATALTMHTVVKQYLMDFQESSEKAFQPCLSLPEDPPAAA